MNLRKKANEEAREKRSFASFVLLEVLLALTLFGLVAVALTEALSQVGMVVVEAQLSPPLRAHLLQLRPRSLPLRRPRHPPAALRPRGPECP